MQDADRRSRATFNAWTRERVRQSDTDQQGHVNNSIVATYFEIGRIDLFGIANDEITPNGVSVVVAKSTIEFLSEIHYPGYVEIGTRIVKAGRTSFSVVQGIFRRDDCFAIAEATCVFIDRMTRKPYPMTEQLRARVLAL